MARSRPKKHAIMPIVGDISLWIYAVLVLPTGIASTIIGERKYIGRDLNKDYIDLTLLGVKSKQRIIRIMVTRVIAIRNLEKFIG